MDLRPRDFDLSALATEPWDRDFLGPESGDNPVMDTTRHYLVSA
jgi:hypothetical protein